MLPLVLSLVLCGCNREHTSQTEPTEIEKIYQMYVANNDSPLTYDDQLASIKGGSIDITISDDGYLVINGIKTNYSNFYFIDAGVSNSPAWPEPEALNNAKIKFSNDSEYNIYFSTIDSGLEWSKEPEDNPDIAHFDSLSEIKLGKLFAEEILKLEAK